jgi:hypothetical protein
VGTAQIFFILVLNEMNGTNYSVWVIKWHHPLPEVLLQLLTQMTVKGKVVRVLNQAP